MGNTTTLGNKSKFRELLDSLGLPRLIIACFLLLLLIAAPCVGLDFPTQITNIITRFSWNAVMVLAMVPMVHSGCGLNFGLPPELFPRYWVWRRQFRANLPCFFVAVERLQASFPAVRVPYLRKLRSKRQC